MRQLYTIQVPIHGIFDAIVEAGSLEEAKAKALEIAQKKRHLGDCELSQIDQAGDIEGEEI